MMRGPSNPLRLFSESTFRFGVRIKQPRLRLTLVPTYSFPSCRIYIVDGRTYYLIPIRYSMCTHFNKRTVLCVVYCACADLAAAPSFTRLFGNASSIGNAAVKFADGPFRVNGCHRRKVPSVVIVNRTTNKRLAKNRNKYNTLLRTHRTNNIILLYML